MKKQILKCIVYIFLIILFLFLCLNSYKRMNEKKIAEKNIQIFHDFCAFSINNNYEFCTESLPKQPVIILFIHPECDFCRAEIRELKENQSEFHNISILLVTSALLEQTKDLYSNQNLNKFSNIQLLLDENFGISNYFDVKTIPTVFIYNRDKKLFFKHKGEIKIEFLIQKIKNEIS